MHLWLNGETMKMKTWAGKGEDFSVSGSVTLGTEITFGVNQNKIMVTAAQYQALLKHFSGKTAEVGTSHDDPPRKSLGKWLQENVCVTQLSSYIAPILIKAKLAWQVDNTQIRFKIYKP
jgi:hypothetical protein